MKKFLLSLLGGFSFALWSLRRRTGQIVPVAASFLLLIGAWQSIGMLQDISSQLVRQQITRNWRGQFDLLIRPQSAVSEPEQSAGWIDPQSLLESYGGISQQQVNSISKIMHVVQVVPVATVGWQPIEELLPVELSQKGLYRISAIWNGQRKTHTLAAQYVEVTDLAHLTDEAQVPHVDVQRVVINDNTKPVVFTMPVPEIQAIVGVPASQRSMISQNLLENLIPASAIPISLHVERLRDGLSSLAKCEVRVDCWIAQIVREGEVSYRSEGVQLLRYTRTQYFASPQQIGVGEVSITVPGSDMQGPLYRELLPGHVSVPLQIEDVTSEELSMHTFLPFAMPQRLPLLTDAVRFVPLEQACMINGENCYSGLYVRLNGVERYNQQSLALLQSIAASIVARTGLHVDILDGSSLRMVSMTIRGPEHSGTIANIQSMWRADGIAVQIEQGMDVLQTVLLGLCSLVCLLAIGSAGVLVGIGRRKEALLLRQLGWRGYMLAAVFAVDGLALCGPGCLLAIGWTMLTMRIGAGGLSSLVAWALLVVGILVYCCSLVVVACFVQRHSSSSAHQAKVVVEFVSGCALTSAVFLIVFGYILISSFNQELVVTVLGRQVHSVLESSQLLLLLIFVNASLLTVGLCTKLLLQRRREELQLLALVGWERRAVMLRVMWGYCSRSLVYGAIGVLLAVAAAILTAAFPSILLMLVLLVCGPLLGASLAGLATISIAWQEIGRVYRWQ